MDWRWVGLDLVLAVHDRQLSEHGGLGGVRDLAAVEFALARPRDLLAYETPDGADLAAAYAYGLAPNHGFADGNKRTAWVVARVFLADNRVRLSFEKLAALQIMGSVAAGAVSERQLAEWFRVRIIPDDPDCA
jgi:death-on-curing protein